MAKFLICSKFRFFSGSFVFFLKHRKQTNWKINEISSFFIVREGGIIFPTDPQILKIKIILENSKIVGSKHDLVGKKTIQNDEWIIKIFKIEIFRAKFYFYEVLYIQIVLEKQFLNVFCHLKVHIKVETLYFLILFKILCTSACTTWLEK